MSLILNSGDKLKPLPMSVYRYLLVIEIKTSCSVKIVLDKTENREDE